ncbi:MAG: hypothetical protein VKJ04_03825 [Vampirovibrionales bacterium]|nr:hypothetical protein [Vampirovibrionales bacterium]
MSKLDELKKRLRPGQVYRRADLEPWSTSVDRHLKQLQEDGTFQRLSGGLYLYPKKTVFGDAPADETALVQAFLKDSRFLLHSPNAYNALGVGATQLYNETVVYNRKRHGRFMLGGRSFDFRIKPDFPKTLTQEFLLVDLINNLDRLAEGRELMKHVREKASALDGKALAKAVRDYGGVRAKKFFTETLGNGSLNRAAS